MKHRDKKVKKSVANQVRQTRPYQEWRKAVLQNGGYMCRYCGTNKKLRIHHIMPMRDILRGHDIRTKEKAMQCKFLFDPINGEIACVKCHHDLHKDDP